jgi:hypothetical protein
MRALRRLLRVVVVLSGLLLLPGRPNVTGRPALSLCASESARCREEVNTFCYETGVPETDRYPEEGP